MLAFFTTLAGPIFAKEMVEIARRKRYYFNRVFYCSVLLFTLFMVYQSNRYSLSGMTGESIRAMARLAEEMFMAASSVQYGAVYLFVPLFLCGVIASEREERTLELLFTTDLRDREIVLGKLLSRLAACVALIVCAMPVMSLITLLGGIDPAWVWRVLAATLLAIVLTGAHSIHASATSKSPMGAVVRTYFWMFVLYLALPVAGMLLIELFLRPRGGGRPNPFEYYMMGLAFLHPLGSFIPALHGRAYDEMAKILGGWFYPGMFVGPLLWSTFLIWRAVRRLRLPPSVLGALLLRSPGISGFREWRTARHERRTRGRGLMRASRWLFGMPITNPLWLRARIARVYDRDEHIGRLQLAAWILAIGFLVLITAVDPGVMDEEGISMTFQALAWIGTAGLAVIIAGMSLTADRRRGFFELVLATPLTGREIFDGTLLAVWQHVRRLYWIIPCLALLFVLTGASWFWLSLASLLTGTLFLALILVYGVGCSLAARSMPGALVPTFAFPIVVIVGSLMWIGLFEEAHGPVFWVVAVFFLVGSWLWVQRRPSAASVGCWLIAMHLAICGLFTCWLFNGSREELPLAGMHPGFLTIAILDHVPLERTFRNWGPAAEVLALPCYWLALGINICLARWWLIANFDRLVERTGQRALKVEWLEEVDAS